MSRPALIRAAREAAKRAHWYLCDEVEVYRCGWQIDSDRRVIGCNVERVHAFLAEGRRLLAIASVAYDACPLTIASASRFEIEDRLAMALRHIDCYAERLANLMGHAHGAIQ